MHQKTLALRFIGFIGSLILTLTAYFIIIRPESFHLKTGPAILIIFILAILQFIVQFVFFLDLWREKGPKWNFAVFLTTLSILFIIIAFSIWIMNHLDYNMMPM